MQSFLSEEKNAKDQEDITVASGEKPFGMNNTLCSNISYMLPFFFTSMHTCCLLINNQNNKTDCMHNLGSQEVQNVWFDSWSWISRHNYCHLYLPTDTSGYEWITVE